MHTSKLKKIVKSLLKPLPESTADSQMSDWLADVCPGDKLKAALKKLVAAENAWLALGAPVAPQSCQETKSFARAQIIARGALKLLAKPAFKEEGKQGQKARDCLADIWRAYEADEDMKALLGKLLVEASAAASQSVDGVDVAAKGKKGNTWQPEAKRRMEERSLKSRKSEQALRGRYGCTERLPAACGRAMRRANCKLFPHCRVESIRLSANRMVAFYDLVLEPLCGVDA